MIDGSIPPDQRSAGQQALVDYCAAVEQMKTTSKTVVVTHKRLPFMPETVHDTIIIDEDILPTLLELGKLPAFHLTDIDTLKDVSDFVERSPDDTWVEIPASLCEVTERLVDEVLASRNSESVLRFLRADGFTKTMLESSSGSPYCELRFGKKLGLPTGKKIIVLSATLNRKLYERAFPDRSVVLHEVVAAEQRGLVVQFAERGFSRISLKRLTAFAEGDLRKIRMLVQDRRTITFQGYKKTLIDLGFNVVEELHFGKCTSTNTMDGFDLVVLGTPHRTQWNYELWACLLGLSTKAFGSRHLSYEPVTRNGYQFNFLTFSDPDLQEIQLHLIESELIQATGRARTLRNDCTVFVFADLPIPGAELCTLPQQLAEPMRLAA